MAANNGGGGSSSRTTTTTTTTSTTVFRTTEQERRRGSRAFCDYSTGGLAKRLRTTTPSSSSQQQQSEQQRYDFDDFDDFDDDDEPLVFRSRRFDDDDVVGYGDGDYVEEAEESEEAGDDDGVYSEDVVGREDGEIREEEEEEVEVGVVEQRAAERGSSGGGGGGDEIVFFMKDTDVLDCPICTDPLTIPVYQCGNGHIACSSCCAKIRNKCPSCTRSIGSNRCRAIEKVVESVQVSCRNLKYGCNDRMFYSKKNEHELACACAPCSCPTRGCEFVGLSKSLYSHYITEHHEEFETFSFDSLYHVYLTKKVKHVILVEENYMKIFVVNHARTDHGSLINIDCIKRSGSKNRYLYSLKNVNGVVKALAENVPNWVEHVPRGAVLMVPQDSSVDRDDVDVEVCIKKDKVLPETYCRMP